MRVTKGDIRSLDDGSNQVNIIRKPYYLLYTPIMVT